MLSQRGFQELNPQKLKTTFGETPMRKRTTNNYLYFFQEEKHKVS